MSLLLLGSEDGHPLDHRILYYQQVLHSVAYLVVGVRRETAKSPPGGAPPHPGRATPRLRCRVRPWWHRVVGASQIAVGVVLIVVNYIDYGGSSLLPGGHQEAYFLLGILVAASSIWWFG